MSRPNNEIRLALAGAAAINPLVRSDAAARQQMVYSHASQALPILGASTRRILTSFERELGKTSFSITMPVNAEVLQVIEKFPRTISSKAAENPLTVVIYEDVDTKEIGVLEIPSYHCLHQHYGFKYKRNRDVMVSRGAMIAAGTIIADTPTKDEYGNACLGREANIAFMSVPGVTEDGVIVSESYVKKLSVKGYEKREIRWGQEWYPLNLYGDEHNYKIFPDIGEEIDPTGLLFGLRKFDPMMDVINMTPRALREPIQNFDRLRYISESGRTERVVDVSVLYEPRGLPLTPVGMDEQVKYYHRAEQKFYSAILEEYGRIRKVRQNSLRITRRFHALLVEAIDYLDTRAKSNVRRMYQHQALDEWRVEVTYEYTAIPNIPFKVSDLHGGKGVIVQVWPDDRMPMDEYGNRADLITDGDSIIKRMNLGRIYEQYINAASRKVTMDVCSMFEAEKPASLVGVTDPVRPSEELGKPRPKPKNWNASTINKAWEYALGYYNIVAPIMNDVLTNGTYPGKPEDHIKAILDDGIYLHFPTDNPVDLPTMVQQIRERYPVPIGPVTYIGDSGKRVTTKSPVLIASIYMVLLEKTGMSDFSGVSSAKAQHFGIPACQGKFDKYASPARSNPVRFGESEQRLFVATIGGEKTSDLLDASNNPITHKAISETILSADQPSNIPLVVDRSVIPLGGNRALAYSSHILQCEGMEFYRPETEEIAPEIYKERSSPEEMDEELELDDDEDIGASKRRRKKSDDDESDDAVAVSEETDEVDDSDDSTDGE